MAKARKPEPAPSGLPTDRRGEAELAEDPAPYSAPDSADDGIAETGVAALNRGRAVIAAALKTIPAGAGVYRMLDRKGEALYVGKARHLKRRVTSYTNPANLTTRLLKMIAETRALEVISTHTEVEALLLESNLIKRLKPRYNILLRDDKSFPFILITADHPWPQIVKHRGARSRPGQYFGPFASAGAVNKTLNTLQKAFPLRTCSDSIFESRSRPCLQYQIKRCTAPCVDRISPQDYGELTEQVRDFLSGRSDRVRDDLLARMQRASEDLAFETAAAYRDRLRALAHVQAHHGIHIADIEEADVMAAHQEAGQTCVQVFFFRSGQNWGNRAYFPSHARDQDLPAVLSAFIGQFYDDKPPPRQVLLNAGLDDQALLAEALAVKAGRKVRLLSPRRGGKRRLVEQALHNAREALGRRLAESASQRRLLEAIADLFGLDATPRRIEVYDNSHTMGRQAIGAMIVAGPDGFEKNAYRKFNIKSETLTPGDDYAMMREVLSRRFTRLLKAAEADGAEADEAGAVGADAAGDGDNRRIAGAWPDLVLIDGGLGQLGVAREVFAELGIGDVALAGIAKGPDRNAGLERIFQPDRAPIALDPKSPVLYFLQRLRDEAHRFAIGTHRARRAKAMIRSSLDEIVGIGPRRKRALLNRFGSAKAVERASLADLEAVEGISKTVAKRLYDRFRDGA